MAEHHLLAANPALWGKCYAGECSCNRYRDPARTPQPAITFHTEDYRGDHAADITISLPYQPAETIEEMMIRASEWKPSRKGQGMRKQDYIVIRMEADDIRMEADDE